MRFDIHLAVVGTLIMTSYDTYRVPYETIQRV